jgi:hypothetical protein
MKYADNLVLLKMLSNGYECEWGEEEKLKNENLKVNIYITDCDRSKTTRECGNNSNI